MVAKKEEPGDEPNQPKPNVKSKRTYLSQTDVPAVPLAEAVRIPRAIYDNYAGDPTTPLNVGAALNMAPKGGTFKTLTGAAIAYGLTEGGAFAPTIALTAIGRRAVAPTEEDDDQRALREAFLRPKIVNDFLTNTTESHSLQTTLLGMSSKKWRSLGRLSIAP